MHLPVEVEGITPDRLFGLTELKIAKLPIWVGRNQVELAEQFKVSIRPSDGLTLAWSGDLSHVHWMGAGMADGEMIIDGNAGRHLGSQMTGGTIMVNGSVSDHAGAEMRGGIIKISSNAGNNLGGIYPGSRSGMNRGEILVSGNVGDGAGQGLRRGLIAIQGATGKLTGWNMLAGTVVVFGKCGSDCGLGMKRGTIIQVSADQEPLLPIFLKSGRYDGYWLRLLSQRLSAHSANSNSWGESLHPLSQPFTLFHGDILSGGRGEVLVAECGDSSA